MQETSPFIWAGGIEDTFIIDPHGTTGKRLEEYELIGHYQRWREDARRAASLGISALRWGIPWYRVEEVRGRFQWGWIDEVVAFLAEELRVDPIIDLIHYGTPPWLPAALLDAEFLPAFRDYVTAFAERYRGRIRYATPFNEPYTAAEFSGRRGDWPPYRRGDEGFIAVMLAASRAASEASRILASHGYTTIHVEVATGVLAGSSADDEAARAITLQNELSWDLITGRVDAQHPLCGWLIAHGAGEKELSWFRDNRASIDILGVNYYPQWSYLVTWTGSDGRRASLPISGGPTLLQEHLRRFWRKYHLPMMITETSVRGMIWEKNAWLLASTAVVAALRTEGIPIMGYTWFPLIDMVDWEYRNQPGDKSDFLMDVGLWTMNREERPCVQTYRAIIAKHRMGTP